MKLYSVILLLLQLPGVERADAQLRLPREKNITVTPDGIVHPKEWEKSRRIPLEKGYTLYLMADSAWLYIATFGAERSSPYTDVYVKAARGIINLHASMQLGERLLPDDNSWDDEKPAWNWGNNTFWTANTVTYKPGASEGLPFYEQVRPYEGQEFRISMSKLEPGFSFLVVVRDFVDPAIYVSFPAMGNVYDAGSWEVIIGGN